MRIFTLATLALAAIASSTQAQEAGIQDTIASQLQAFNDRDVTAAWQYASPMIQGMFGTPENFGMMVERGYPMVWTNSDVTFTELSDINGVLWQQVMLRDAQGTLHVLAYQMIEGENGWQINGVTILPAPEMGV